MIHNKCKIFKSKYNGRDVSVFIWQWIGIAYYYIRRTCAMGWWLMKNKIEIDHFAIGLNDRHLFQTAQVSLVIFYILCCVRCSSNLETNYPEIVSIIIFILNVSEHFTLKNIKFSFFLLFLVVHGSCTHTHDGSVSNSHNDMDER